MMEVIIQLPDELIKKIDKLVETSTLDYEDRDEFIKEATRIYYRKMKD